MNYKSCEECYKKIPIERIVIKPTADGDCFYCRMCFDYIQYLDTKAQELMLVYNIDQSTIQKEVDEMNSL